MPFLHVIDLKSLGSSSSDRTEKSAVLLLDIFEKSIV